MIPKKEITLTIEQAKLEKCLLREKVFEKSKNFYEWLKFTSPQLDWDMPHLGYMRQYLQKILDGETQRLIFHVPPQHGKSTQNTVHFIADYLIRYPHRYVILCCYNSRLAKRFSKAIRKIVDSQISIPMNARFEIEDWETGRGGGLRSAGVGAGITGMPADLIVIDDPIKGAEDAFSITTRDKQWDWWASEPMSRAHNNTSLIITMSRWHHDDLVGRILRKDKDNGWLNICIPAFALEGDMLGREKGEVLWSERFSKETLQKKREVAPIQFESLYQGSPSVEGGNIFKEDAWNYYNENLDLSEFHTIIASLDTASKKGTTSDFSAVVVFGIKKEDSGEDHIYVIDIYRGKYDIIELEEKVLDTFKKYNPVNFLIEDTSNGVALIQVISRRSFLPVHPIKPTSSKEVRAIKVAGIQTTGKIHLPANHPNLYDFRAELGQFPASSHDDYVDAFTQGLGYIQDNQLSNYSNYESWL